MTTMCRGCEACEQEAEPADAMVLRPRELPVYCSYCKGHIRGPEAVGGVNGQGVSHGICGACKDMVLSGLSVRTIQEVREIELKVQLEALRNEIGGRA